MRTKEEIKKYKQEYDLKNKEILKKKRFDHRAEKKKYNDVKNFLTGFFFVFIQIHWNSLLLKLW